MTTRDKSQRLVVEKDGVRVIMHVDERGRPLTAIASCWQGDETITKLATDHVLMVADRKADTAIKAEQNATRTAKSTETLRKKSEEFWLWALERLTRAHRAHPYYRGKKLATEARKILYLSRNAGEKEAEAYAKRDEINVYRAKEFLTGLKDRARADRG